MIRRPGQELILKGPAKRSQLLLHGLARLQERDAATQRRDVPLSAAEQASEQEKTALSSLQSISDPHLVVASCVFCDFMVLN